MPSAVVDWAVQLKPHFAQPITSVRSQTVSSLWAGYGSVCSLTVKLQGKASPVRLIVKDVRPPKATGVGHERKVASYQVEAAFYKHVAPSLIESTGLGLPRPLAISNETTGFQFLLSDLRDEYPEPAPDILSDFQTRTVLTWLATYHAHFWERPTPEGLQPQGSYWYLDTRREEFESIGRSWADLKAVAEQVDARLKRPSTQEFLTCIHGDMKNENILFTRDGARCAVYDFQYTGTSYGVRDVVYLFTSSVDSAHLAAHEAALLDHYHQELCSALVRQGRADAAARYTRDVMARHLDLALLDYVRFMAGWGMWGSGRDWAVRRARAALRDVDALLA